MIDILLAAYNGSLYIEEQINSICRQSFQDWRLIIHDDQSTDNTLTIINSLKNKYEGIHDIHVSVNTKAYGCAPGNFMGLLARATGDYVMFSDQDDQWHPNKIEKSLKAMHRLENKYGKDVPLLIFTDLHVVDSQLNEISSSFQKYMNLPPKITLNRLMIQNSISGCTILMNKALYILLKQAEDLSKILMHDHFAALIAAALGNMCFIPDATINYRQHGKNVVGASNANSVSYLWHRYKRGRKAFRNDLFNSMIQAGYIYNLYMDKIQNENKRNLIREYSELIDKNKWTRLKFYLTHHAIKYGCLRAVMQFVWG